MLEKEYNEGKVTKKNSGYINPYLLSHNLKYGEKSTIAVDDYVAGIRSSDRKILAKSITLIESTKPADKIIANQIIKRCLPFTGNSFRIGISGIPGAGKSTFIDSFGSLLIKKNKKIAVLAIDPSSKITKGSILGDKTRMKILSKSENAFIRPSPTSGMLGGIAQKTRESIILCEAAGYDIIIIETVGTGQSEIAVSYLVDVFLLLQIAGGGDELQAMKKGAIEVADFILINKADGENLKSANYAQQQLASALKFVTKIESGWTPLVKTCSAKENYGLEEIWKDMQKFLDFIKKSGYFIAHREKQELDWMYEIIEKSLKNNFFESDIIKKNFKKYEKAILVKKMTSFVAAKKLLNLYYNNLTLK